MKTRKRPALAAFSLSASLCFSLAGCHDDIVRYPDTSADSDVVQGNQTATAAAIGASDAALGPAFGAPPAVGPGGPGGFGPGCQPVAMVVSTAMACGNAYPSEVELSWSCTFADGGTFSGNDHVETTLTPDNCPATTITVAQQITLDQTRTKDAVVATVDGTGTADFTVLAPPPPTPGQTPLPPPPPLSRTLTLDVSVVAVDGANALHDAQVTGVRTVALDDGGTPFPAIDDDSIVDDGSVSIEDTATDATVDIVDADITHVRDCCHPVAGSSTLTIGVLSDPSAPVETHGITFGPSCGEATRDDGIGVILPPCPAPPPGP